MQPLGWETPAISPNPGVCYSHSFPSPHPDLAYFYILHPHIPQWTQQPSLDLSAPPSAPDPTKPCVDPPTVPSTPAYLDQDPIVAPSTGEQVHKVDPTYNHTA